MERMSGRGKRSEGAVARRGDRLYSDKTVVAFERTIRLIEEIDEVIETVRKNVSIDWAVKQSSRVRMRVLVKRIDADSHGLVSA